MKTNVLSLSVAAQMELAREVLSLTHQQLIQLCRERNFAFSLNADHFVRIESFYIHFDKCVKLSCSFYKGLDKVPSDTCRISDITMDNLIDPAPWLGYCNQFESSSCGRRWKIPETNIEISYSIYHQGKHLFQFQVLEE